jgi:DNA invertase Pin-like site-specific DNA recombinase
MGGSGEEGRGDAHQQVQRAAIYVRVSPGRPPAEAELAQLRDFARAQGWELAGEYLDRGPDPPGRGWERLLELASGGPHKLDVVLVPGIAEAFHSVDQLGKVLRRLSELGASLVSYSEPWFGTAAWAAQSQPAGAISHQLEGTLTRYLEKRLRAAEREEEQYAKGRRRAEIQSEVGQMVTYLLLLAGYALLLGIASRPLLIEALLNPGDLARRLADSSNALASVTNAVPEALRGLVLSAVGALGLFVFRAASFNIRADIGGVLFIGVVVLALGGLSAAASAGLVGALAALPGFAASGVLVYEFAEMLRRLERSGSYRRSHPKAAPRRRLLSRLDSALSGTRTLLDPIRSRVAGIIFVAFPILAVLTVAAAVLAHGGPLFWPARSALVGLAGWSIWACYFTPSAIRIPLWSMVVWAGLFLALVAFGWVSAIFAVAVVILLIGNVTIFTLRWPRA